MGAGGVQIAIRSLKIMTAVRTFFVAILYRDVKNCLVPLACYPNTQERVPLFVEVAHAIFEKKIADTTVVVYNAGH